MHKVVIREIVDRRDRPFRAFLGQDDVHLLATGLGDDCLMLLDLVIVDMDSKGLAGRDPEWFCIQVKLIVGAGLWPIVSEIGIGSGGLASLVHNLYIEFSFRLTLQIDHAHQTGGGKIGIICGEV